MEKNIVFYTIHCPMCRKSQKMMDAKNISYQVIDNRKDVLQKAEELNFTDAPFAAVNDQWYDNKNLKKWIEEYAK